MHSIARSEKGFATNIAEKRMRTAADQPRAGCRLAVVGRNEFQAE